MRNLDNRNVYTVDGRPFFGRFIFYKLHTTEKIVITDEAGSALSNPMLSDIEGRTAQQVFLPDIDVTVVLQKYVGSGDMNEDMENVSSWAEAMTFDSLKNTVVIDIGDDTVVAGSAGTVDSLRNMDISAMNYAVLRGYYELGDMPPVYYKLEYDTTSTDDGGSVIRVDTTHVWKLITPQILDVRVFGVFPSMTYTNITAYNSQLFLAFRYANSLGIAVYMPAVYEGGGYYALEGGDHQLNQTLYLDTGTHLCAKNGTTNTLTVDKIEGAATGFFFYHPEFNTGSLTMSVKSCRSSWLSTWAQTNYKLQPTEEIIIDTNIRRQRQLFSNLQRVYIEKKKFLPSGQITFANIQNFESPGNISLRAHIIFRDMLEIKDTWWNLTNADHKLRVGTVSLVDCTFYMHDFLYPENYCILANAVGIKSFNLEGRTYNASVTDVYEDTTWMNGEISKLNLKGNVTLRNITGSVYGSTSNILGNISIEDSYLTGSLPFSIQGNVYIKSSSFSYAQSSVSTLPFLNGSSCVIRDSIFSGYMIQCPYNATITGCTFSSNDLGARTLINVYANSTNGYISCVFSNNVMDKAKLVLTRASAIHPITVKNSAFVNNAITDSYDGTNFIQWNQPMAESGHVYSYSNNDGPDVLQQETYTVVLKNIPTWFNDGTTPPYSLYLEYYGPEQTFNQGKIWVPGTPTTISLPDGGVVNIPGGHYEQGAQSWAYKCRLVGLTVAHLNLFCFSYNDFSNKQLAVSVYNSVKEGEDTGRYLSTGLNQNSIGIPANLSLPDYTYGPFSTESSAAVPVPYAYQDLVLTTTLTDVRVIN